MRSVELFEALLKVKALRVLKTLIGGNRLSASAAMMLDILRDIHAKWKQTASTLAGRDQAQQHAKQIGQQTGLVLHDRYATLATKRAVNDGSGGGEQIQGRRTGSHLLWHREWRGSHMRDGAMRSGRGGRGGDVDGCRHVVEICRGKKCSEPTHA